MIPAPDKSEAPVAFVLGAVIVFMICGTAMTRCHGSEVTPAFVDWAIQRESKGNPKARGKNGEVGLLQIKRIALADVNADAGTNYTMRDLLDPVVNRWVGTRFMHIQERRLVAYLRRQPSQSEIYGAFRRGFKGVMAK